MNIDDFRRIVSAFADRPEDVEVDKGQFLVQIRGDVIHGGVSLRDGELVVSDAGNSVPAARWIVERLANLDMLAQRILDRHDDDRYFVDPDGSLLDVVDRSPDDNDEQPISGVGGRVIQLLQDRIAGSSTVLYLTSDAGEGKTTVINHLARRQANAYQTGASTYLIVPISLGGRTFLRFDDVIVGTLVNTLRFQFLYFDAFIELVRLGYIVPALDGFEEMFVEGPTGDAVSALGNLMETLSSEGAVIIAARQAYFEYKNLHVQGPLFDSIGKQSVTFGRLALKRWSRETFVQYADQRGISNPERIYAEVASRLERDHPVLTRAVLVKGLLDLAADDSDRHELVERLRTEKDFFHPFVRSIIQRESREKWIDKSGEAAQPLLSEEGHHELLSEVAVEMWISESAHLKSEMLEYVADIYSEDKGLELRVVTQVIERVKQHALIVRSEGLAEGFCFDHEEYYHFFLGEGIGRYIVEQDTVAVQRVLRVGPLPYLALDVAASSVMRGDLGSLRRAVISLNEVCRAEPMASFSKDNSGELVMRLVDGWTADEKMTIERFAFGIDALDRELDGWVFRECYFRRTVLGRVTSCVFDGCQFDQLDFGDGENLDDVVFDGCSVASVVDGKTGISVFDPEGMADVLIRYGIRLVGAETRAAAVEIMRPDRELVVAEKMCRAFLRSTGINENTFRQRLGTDSSMLFDDVLPVLIDEGVVEEVSFTGRGQQRRYRLAVSLRDVQRAIEVSKGNFRSFLKEMGRRRSRE